MKDLVNYFGCRVAYALALALLLLKFADLIMPAMQKNIGITGTCVLMLAVTVFLGYLANVFYAWLIDHYNSKK